MTSVNVREIVVLTVTVRVTDRFSLTVFVVEPEGVFDPSPDKVPVWDCCGEIERLRDTVAVRDVETLRKVELDLLMDRVCANEAVAELVRLSNIDTLRDFDFDRLGLKVLDLLPVSVP